MFAMDQVLLKLSPLRDDLLLDIQHKLVEYAERGSSTAATLTSYTSGRSTHAAMKENVLLIVAL
jgi:hypothetical protein